VPIALAFNCAKSSVYKSAEFDDPDQKRDYVDAEMADLACQDAYFDYQKAKTLAARLDAARVLDGVRWAHYKRWRNQRRAQPSDEPLQAS
jgi:hypothetical protein